MIEFDDTNGHEATYRQGEMILGYNKEYAEDFNSNLI